MSNTITVQIDREDLYRLLNGVGINGWLLMDRILINNRYISPIIERNGKLIYDIQVLDTLTVEELWTLYTIWTLYTT